MWKILINLIILMTKSHIMVNSKETENKFQLKIKMARLNSRMTKMREKFSITKRIITSKMHRNMINKVQQWSRIILKIPIQPTMKIEMQIKTLWKEVLKKRKICRTLILMSFKRVQLLRIFRMMIKKIKSVNALWV